MRIETDWAPPFRHDCTAPTRAGLRQRVRWRHRDRLTADGPSRIRVDFIGVRPEDTKLYAVYAEPAE